jgi:membrane protease YdiL (CAAX protease family)
MWWPSGQYWTATRHPWSCVLFVVPLLAVYEIGLYFLGPNSVTLLRNGADTWLRSGLASAGMSPAYGAPIALILVLLIWTLLYREQAPPDPVGVWLGMALESVAFAGLLYGVSQAVGPVLHSAGGLLDGKCHRLMAIPPVLNATAGSATPQADLGQLVRYIGAGIYEETLFRLLLFSGLVAAFNLADLPRRWGIAFATVASSLLFAGAHNLGARGEDFHAYAFLFRTSAGVYFSWVYCVRGFGIAVGAHAGYDVLVALFAP